MVGLGVALGIGGALVAIWANWTFKAAEGAEYYSSGFGGSSIAEAESAGFIAGLKAAALPSGLAVLLVLAAVALLVAAAVRREPRPS